MFRRWLLLLICVALPLQAAASTWQFKAPCPMEAEMAALLAAGELAGGDLPDCCNDAETFALTGKACKTGQECGAATTALPAPATGRMAAPQCHERPQPVAAWWPAGLVANPWRPPTSL
jgi:hypothetical protein